MKEVACCQATSQYFTKAVERSHEIKTVQVHHLGPGCYKVLHELLAGILTTVYFGDGA